MSKNVFSGDAAIRSYLQPDVKNFTPLVELPAGLNPYLKSHNIHVYIKLLNTLPLGNVKSLPAWNMLARANRDLHGATVVESSSGNTVLSLGLLANTFGVRKVQAIASRDVTPGKLNLLRIAGIDVQLIDGPMCPSPDDPNSSIAIAHEQAKRHGWFNPGQYDNDDNPDAHRHYTGPQVFEQLNGSVDMFVAGLGTTGTLVGTAEYLCAQNPNTKVVGVVRVPNNAVPGVRTKNGLQEVAFGWANAITDELVAVNERTAYEQSLALIRHGLLVGPSAGFALAGLLKHLEACEDRGDITELAHKNIVFVAPDSMFPYVDEYLDVLDDTSFGIIDDQTTQPLRDAASELVGVPELSVDDVYGDFVRTGDEMRAEHYTIVDVRTEREFADHHIAGSVQVDFDALDDWLRAHEYEKPLVFVCRRGSVSTRAAQLALRSGATAYSMIGGTAAWSDRGFPRITPLTC